MTQKFEVPELKNESAKEPKEKGGGVNLSPKPETVTGMEKSLQKQQEVRKEEEKQKFCDEMDVFKKGYEIKDIKVGEDSFNLKLEHIEVAGTKVDEENYAKLKESLIVGKIDINQVGGVFSMEGKGGGLKLQYSIPSNLMVNPEGLSKRLNDDFGGGTKEYYKNKEKAATPAPEARVEKPQAESAVEKGNKDRQIEDARMAAQKGGGEASILSGKGLTTLIVSYPKGRQLRISSTTGALWSCEENENGRKTSLGSKATLMEFLLSGEKDPGT